MPANRGGHGFATEQLGVDLRHALRSERQPKLEVKTRPRLEQCPRLVSELIYQWRLQRLRDIGGLIELAESDGTTQPACQARFESLILDEVLEGKSCEAFCGRLNEVASCRSSMKSFLGIKRWGQSSRRRSWLSVWQAISVVDQRMPAVAYAVAPLTPIP
jgi:hypothetical protein